MKKIGIDLIYNDDVPRIQLSFHKDDFDSVVEYAREMRRNCLNPIVQFSSLKEATEGMIYINYGKELNLCGSVPLSTRDQFLKYIVEKNKGQYVIVFLREGKRTPRTLWLPMNKIYNRDYDGDNAGGSEFVEDSARISLPVDRIGYRDRRTRW